MEMDEFLEGEALTGREAIIVFFAFLILIVLGALFMIAFSDVFRSLVYGVSW